MNPSYVATGHAYGEAGDQRNRGPGEAARYGAVGVLVRSLTLAHDDIPHTGNTSYLPDVPRIPAAALSTVAADHFSRALKDNPALTAELIINSTWFEPAPSHNVIGELTGHAHPEKIILVGGHLDCWDIAPGAHDDGVDTGEEGTVDGREVGDLDFFEVVDGDLVGVAFLGEEDFDEVADDAEFLHFAGVVFDV